MLTHTHMSQPSMTDDNQPCHSIVNPLISTNQQEYNSHDSGIHISKHETSIGWRGTSWPKTCFCTQFFNLFPLYLLIHCIPINYTTILNLNNVCCLNTRVVRSVDEITISQTYPDMIWKRSHRWVITPLLTALWLFNIALEITIFNR
jgi:hypothetical protein